MNYNFAQIEKKWQDIWDAKNVFAATNDYTKPKYYALVEFPYPSGKGLHVGHPRSYTALDIVARKRRMEGYNVLYPMGWDAFGLPTENFAIKNHIHPEIVTQQNINRFKSQLKAWGFLLTGTGRSTPQTPIIINGLSGSSCSCLRRGWPIKKKCPSTGVLPANACWPMKKWLAACASAAVLKLSIRSKASGC